MTITTGRSPVSAGTGYQYLTSSVAAADGDLSAAEGLLRYYSEHGTPPGRWLGQGLSGLADGTLQAHDTVTEDQMRRLFGVGSDPVTGEVLSQVHTVPTPLRERIAARLADMPVDLSAEERATFEQQVSTEERERRVPASRAGFDLTFQVPKSASALWAVSDAGVQAQIARAHHEAIDETLALIEREVLMTRAGKAGAAQLETRGLVAAAFDHYDSRAGDPHLHTHVLVANRVQGTDGKWRTVDSRAMYKALVAMSRTHEALFVDRMAQYLPVEWQADSAAAAAQGKVEISGVPTSLREEFSQRRLAILAERQSQLDAFRAKHGRAPSERESRALDMRSWQDSRSAKHGKATLADLTRSWRERAIDVLRRLPGHPLRLVEQPEPEQAAGWVRDLLQAGQERSREPVLRRDDLSDQQLAHYAADVLGRVADKRSTWTRWNLHSEAAAALIHVRFASAEDRLAVLDAVVEHATVGSVMVSALGLAHTPAAFTRGDGSSVFEVRHGQLYTSHEVLAAEDYLLTRLRATDQASVTAHSRVAALEAFETTAAYPLTTDQLLAIEQITASGRGLDVLVGPAGAGKTTTLAALRATWEHEHGHGSVVGLAPSAAAAAVLGDELGIPTDNTAKWLTELDALPERRQRLAALEERLARLHQTGVGDVAALADEATAVREQIQRWSLRSGDLLVVDEASLAGTFAVERITRDAEANGAKVVLVGDPYQLSAVQAGGAFSLAAGELGADAPRLSTIHRFTQPWEAAASLLLRTGRTEVIDTYAAHDRIIEGSEEVVLDEAYRAWQSDLAAGKTSLLVAADNETVAGLNARAQSDRHAAGLVATPVTGLHDGSMVGTGDVIVTRRNDRHLATSRSSWVKNGDRWRVMDARGDGALIVQRESGGSHIALPAHYVATHVELGYAATTHRAQGATVDTAHALVADGTNREALYVAATRGRQTNRLYVATSTPQDLEDHTPVSQLPTGREVLASVLANTGAATSAHQQITDEQETAASIATLATEYDTIAVAATQQRWSDLIATAPLSQAHKDDVVASPAWSALQAALRRADSAGLQPERGFPMLIEAQELDTADDVAAVMHRRVEAWLASTERHQRGPSSARYVCGLIPASTISADTDLGRALHEREELMTQRAEALVDREREAGSAWAQPPIDLAQQARHHSAAITVAAYRDKWAVAPHSSQVLGPPGTTDLTQRAEYRRAQAALRTIDTLDQQAPVEVEQPQATRTMRGPVMGG